MIDMSGAALAESHMRWRPPRSVARAASLLVRTSLVAPVCSVLPQEIVSYAGPCRHRREERGRAADALDAPRRVRASAVATLDDAWPDGPRVHPGGTWPRASLSESAIPRCVARADVVVRTSGCTGARHGTRDSRIVARWDAELGQMTLWSTTQSPQS
jgi:hypothetical protein